MASANAELVRAIYAEWQEGRFGDDAFYTEDVEFSYDYGLDLVKASGIEEMARVWQEHLALWERWHTGPIEEIREAGDDLVIVHRLHGRGKQSGLETEMLAGAVFSFADGRVSGMRFYGDHRRALTEAGLEE